MMEEKQDFETETEGEARREKHEASAGRPQLPRRRGFASMDQARQREIASKGGHASGGNFANNPQRAAEAGRKGGQVSGGNFAHNPQRAAEAGRKGGHVSGSNFANDPVRASAAGRKGGEASHGRNPRDGG